MNDFQAARIAELSAELSAAQGAVRILEMRIREGQKVLEDIKRCTPQLTPEGWAALNLAGSPPSRNQQRFADRHGCAWNEKESRDLLRSFLQRETVEVIALQHRRSEGILNSQLSRLLSTGNVRSTIDMIMNKENL